MIQTNFTSYVPTGSFVSRASSGGQDAPPEAQDGPGPAREDAGLMPSRLPGSQAESRPNRSSSFGALGRTVALCVALLAAGGLSGCASIGQHGRGPNQEPPSASYQTGQGMRQVGQGFRDLGVGLYEGVLKPIGHAARDSARDFSRGISGQPPQEQPPAQQRR
ncbi:hypothetical protein DYH09_11270 [bacterium CPR1]|nr:hypothetical protein [bacterium CPR1]